MALADMNDTGRAYAAGFLDADGCVSVSRCALKTKAGFYTYRIAVLVANKLPEVPEWMGSYFGGSVKIQKGRTGKDGKSYPPMFVWSLYNNRAADFLEQVVPFLKIKRERAKAAIRLARMQRPRGGMGFRFGGKVISIDELQEREALAVAIRNSNRGTSARVSPIVQQEFA